MRQIFTAVVKREDDLWIGWIAEVPGANCQESTRAELLQSLRIALTEALELSREKARSTAGAEYEEAPIVV